MRCTFSMVLVCVLCLTGLMARKGNAVPPAPWRIGTLVFVDFSASNSHLMQFPGAPDGFDCTDTFSSDWCLWMSCNTVSSSTYTCETAPTVHTCLAIQIASGQAQKITNVDSDACK